MRVRRERILGVNPAPLDDSERKRRRAASPRSRYGGQQSLSRTRAETTHRIAQSATPPTAQQGLRHQRPLAAAARGRTRTELPSHPRCACCLRCRSRGLFKSLRTARRRSDGRTGLVRTGTSKLANSIGTSAPEVSKRSSGVPGTEILRYLRRSQPENPGKWVSTIAISVGAADPSSRARAASASKASPAAVTSSPCARSVRRISALTMASWLTTSTRVRFRPRERPGFETDMRTAPATATGAVAF